MHCTPLPGNLVDNAMNDLVRAHLAQPNRLDTAL